MSDLIGTKYDTVGELTFLQSQNNFNVYMAKIYGNSEHFEFSSVSLIMIL